MGILKLKNKTTLALACVEIASRLLEIASSWDLLQPDEFNFNQTLKKAVLPEAF